MPTILSRIRASLRALRDRLTTVDGGCCGCGHGPADVLTLADDRHPCTEGWCWACFDSSPVLWAAPQRVIRARTGES